MSMLQRYVARAWPFALIALAIFWTVPGHATRIRPLNIEELTRKASRIVSGRCISVEIVEDADLGKQVTRVTIDVSRAIKGHAGSTLTFRMLGNGTPAGSGTGPVGLPRFKPGEEVILFLYGDSRAGLTSPVGFGQGKFVKVHNDKGDSLAINEFGNRTLFRELSPQAAERLQQTLPAGARGQAVSADELIDLIESLGR